MKADPQIPDKNQRCKALAKYKIFDTPPEQTFDDLARLAASLCATPISNIAFFDGERVYYKSQLGYDFKSGPSSDWVSAHSIDSSAPVQVEDITKDQRFANCQLVATNPLIRFYAGIPLLTADGTRIGALCVIDKIPRRLSSEQLAALNVVANQVMAQLELRQHLNELARVLDGHREVEARLKTSETFYQTLVESLPQNILRKDTQGHFTFANQKFCQSVGKSLDEILGNTDYDLFPIDLANKYHRDDMRVINTQENLDTIEAHQGPQGAKMFVHVIKTPLYDSLGTVIGIQGIFWDVTQRRRIEEDLAYERDLLGSLLDHIPDRIYFKDIYSRFMRCSRSMATRLGLEEPRDVVGKTDFDFHPADMAREFFHDEQRILLTAEPLINKLEKQVGTDGKEIWASVTKVPIFSQSGTITGIVGLSRDITQLKETERALRQAEEKYRAIYENSVEGIFQTTRDGKFISANPALARMYGYASPSELVSTLTDIAHQLYVTPGRREEFRSLVLKHGSVTGFESEIFRRDGTKIWISESARTVTDSMGRFQYYEGIVEDITARKLADNVREQARETALENAKTKAQFLANMSHEIRTPMNAIVGMTGMLLDTRLSLEQREYVDTILNSTESLLDIINDVLDFSKMEAGKLQLETIEFNLRDIVETTVEMLAERAHRKRIELVCSLATNVPRNVRGDPVRLRQILTNLVSNAVKFTDAGEVLMRVTLSSTSATQSFLRFEVQDTGIGIPPESLDRIFHEFTQADGSTTRRYGGTGLGLTICRQLVEMMSGMIGVESKKDEGSTFWIEIPFQCSIENSNDDDSSLKGTYIYLVDETFSYRTALANELRTLGAIVVEAPSPTQALQELSQAAETSSPVDIVLIDSDSAGSGGVSLAEEIRNNSALHSMKIVILCTHLDRLSPATMATIGISACLVKPVRQSRLKACLTGLLTISPDFPDPAISEVVLPTGSSMSGLIGVMNPRILLAEDNLINQRVALKQIMKLGFSADTVSNGIEVLSALQRTPYEIIIMDCQMPEMDGYEVTTRIRQSSHESYIHLRSAPYIIALTANALQDDRQKCLALGMNDYLTKPLHLHQLDAALQRATARSSSSRPPPNVLTPFNVETLDYSVIDGLRTLREPGEPDPLRELIELFLRDSAVRLAAMDLAMVQVDTQKLSMTAHSLKGSASNLGARRLALLCENVENSIRESNGSPPESMLCDIKKEMDEVEKFLRNAIE